MSSKFLHRPKEQRGFTIVELMIATLVFSMVLLLITFGILQITRVYYKGVTETNTQNTARGIADVLSQAIQFSGVTAIQPTTGSVPGTTYAFCIGNQRFTYVLGRQVVDSKTPPANETFHALVQDNTASCAGPPAPIVASLVNTQTIAAPHRELVGKRMRLSKLAVTQVSGTTNLWRVTVKVVYGDDDLIGGTGAPTGPNVNCKVPARGTHFCSVSELNTIVTKRVQ